MGGGGHTEGVQILQPILNEEVLRTTLLAKPQYRSSQAFVVTMMNTWISPATSL